MSTDASDEQMFDGTCPWCTTPATLPIDGRVICESRRCACGAISLGAPARDFDEVIDDALNYFRVRATATQKNFEPSGRWLRASGVQIVEGGVGDPEPHPSMRVRHYWFRRSSFLDAPVLSERMFFPQKRWPPAVVAVECAGATLACAAFRPHPDGPVLVHFHGNGETVADYVPEAADAFAAVGLNTLFVEYRGYGASTGTPSLVVMLADVERVLAGLYRVPPERVFVYGRSIGSIYAIEAVRRQPALGGLILESGIADPLERILVRVSAAELGVDDAELRREVATHLDHRAKLAGYPGRVLVVHARHDHLIDLSHAERNASWARNGQLLVFDHGDHNTVLAYNLPAIVEAVARFVRG